MSRRGWSTERRSSTTGRSRRHRRGQGFAVWGAGPRAPLGGAGLPARAPPALRPEPVSAQPRAHRLTEHLSKGCPSLPGPVSGGAEAPADGAEGGRSCSRGAGLLWKSRHPRSLRSDTCSSSPSVSVWTCLSISLGISGPSTAPDERSRLRARRNHGLGLVHQRGAARGVVPGRIPVPAEQ